MSYRGQGLPGACPVPCFSTWSSPRDASLPSFGSQRAWFPALAGTMKALRLPTCASAVAYFVHFRRPRDPSVFVFAIAPEAPSRSWRGGGPLPAPGLGCRPPAVPAHSRGRQWDLSGLQVIHPVSLLRSWTPVEPMCPCLGGHIGAAPTSGTVKASDDKHFAQGALKANGSGALSVGATADSEADSVSKCAIRTPEPSGICDPTDTARLKLFGWSAPIPVGLACGPVVANPIA